MERSDISVLWLLLGLPSFLIAISALFVSLSMLRFDWAIGLVLAFVVASGLAAICFRI
jgi:hypothetical protein